MRRSDFLRSTGVRFTLLYVALYLLSAVVLLVTLYWFEARSLDRDIRDRVDARIEELQEAYKFGGLREVVQEIDTRHRAHVKLRTFYRLTDAQGRVLVANLPDEGLATGWKKLTIEMRVGSEPENIRVVTHTTTLDGATLTVGIEPVWREAVDSLFLRAALGTLIAAVLLGGGIGALMTSRFLRRIDEITSTVVDIMGGQLHSRVETRDTNDELDRLAGSLNAMLDRIDFLVTETREVTNSVAHDLRTPLSRLGRRLEEARAAGAASVEGAKALELAIDESAGILETFNAILRIAQVEGATSAATFTSVDLSGLTETLAEAYGPLAEEEGRPFIAQVPPRIEVRGDRALLMQMLSNLMENALKHTPAGTPVRLSLERVGGRVRVIIEDHGRGIPVDARERVFERFVRLEPSRTTPGNGLGLSLVAAIAKLHGIAISLEDAKPGLRMVLNFPAWNSDRQAQI